MATRGSAKANLRHLVLKSAVGAKKRKSKNWVDPDSKLGTVCLTAEVIRTIESTWATVQSSLAMIDSSLDSSQECIQVLTEIDRCFTMLLSSGSDHHCADSSTTTTTVDHNEDVPPPTLVNLVHLKNLLVYLNQTFGNTHSKKKKNKGRKNNDDLSLDSHRKKKRKEGLPLDYVVSLDECVYTLFLFYSIPLSKEGMKIISRLIDVLFSQLAECVNSKSVMSQSIQSWKTDQCLNDCIAQMTVHPMPCHVDNLAYLVKHSFIVPDLNDYHNLTNSSFSSMISLTFTQELSIEQSLENCLKLITLFIHLMKHLCLSQINHHYLDHIHEKKQKLENINTSDAIITEGETTINHPTSDGLLFSKSSESDGFDLCRPSDLQQRIALLPRDLITNLSRVFHFVFSNHNFDINELYPIDGALLLLYNNMDETTSAESISTTTEESDTLKQLRTDFPLILPEMCHVIFSVLRASSLHRDSKMKAAMLFQSVCLCILDGQSIVLFQLFRIILLSFDMSIEQSSEEESLLLHRKIHDLRSLFTKPYDMSLVPWFIDFVLAQLVESNVLQGCVGEESLNQSNEDIPSYLLLSQIMVARSIVSQTPYECLFETETSDTFSKYDSSLFGLTMDLFEQWCGISNPNLRVYALQNLSAWINANMKPVSRMIQLTKAPSVTKIRLSSAETFELKILTDYIFIHLPRYLIKIQCIMDCNWEHSFRTVATFVKTIYERYINLVDSLKEVFIQCSNLNPPIDGGLAAQDNALIISESIINRDWNQEISVELMGMTSGGSGCQRGRFLKLGVLFKKSGSLNVLKMNPDLLSRLVDSTAVISGLAVTLIQDLLNGALIALRKDNPPSKSSGGNRMIGSRRSKKSQKRKAKKKKEQSMMENEEEEQKMVGMRDGDHSLDPSLIIWRALWMDAVMYGFTHSNKTVRQVTCHEILKYLLKIDPSAYSAIISHILHSSSKKKNSNEDDLMTSSVNDGNQVSSSMLAALIAVLRSAKKSGAISSAMLDQWLSRDMSISHSNDDHDSDLVTLDITLLKQALLHGDRNIRMHAMDIICGSSGITDLPGMKQLELLKEVLPFWMHFQVSVERDQFVQLMQRLLARLRNGCFSATLESDIKQQIIEFIQWLKKFLMKQLYPGSPVERMRVAVTVYYFMVRIWCPRCGESEDDPSSVYSLGELEISAIPEVQRLRKNLTSDRKIIADSLDLKAVLLDDPLLVELLINCMVNGWDYVRGVSAQVLAQMPSSSPFPGFETTERVSLLVRESLLLASSPRLVESNSGAMLLACLFEKYVCRLRWKLLLHLNNKDDDESGDAGKSSLSSMSNMKELSVLVSEESGYTSQNDAVFDFVDSFTNRLRVCVSKIEETAHHQRYTVPSERVHGLLTFLHEILPRVQALLTEPSLVGGSGERWRTLLFDRLLPSVIKVGRLSLELHLRDVTQKTSERAGPSADSSVTPTPNGSDTSVSRLGVDCRGHMQFALKGHDSSMLRDQIDEQLIVVSSWLAVKEACMTLASLVEHFVGAVVSDSPCRMSLSSVEEAGSFLIDTLHSTHHSGVIEKAGLAYASVCRALLDSGDSEMTDLVQKWLDDCVDSIADPKVTEQHWIRRSAGFPCIITSVLEAEVRVFHGSRGSVMFNSAMKRLMQLAEGNSDTSKSGECCWQSRVVALNVLTVVFKSSPFGVVSVGYVSRAFRSSLLGFSHSQWAVRNSSLMCLSAVASRAVRTAENVISISKSNQHGTDLMALSFGHLKCDDDEDEFQEGFILPTSMVADWLQCSMKMSRDSDVSDKQSNVDSSLSSLDSLMSGGISGSQTEGGAFFSQFPSLHAFLLSHLDSAAKKWERDHTGALQPSLISLFHLISRLQARADDSEVSVHGLTAFHSLILPFLSHCHERVRLMSARALVSCVPRSRLISELVHCIRLLPSYEHLSSDDMEKAEENEHDDLLSNKRLTLTAGRGSESSAAANSSSEEDVIEDEVRVNETDERERHRMRRMQRKRKQQRIARVRRGLDQNQIHGQLLQIEALLSSLYLRLPCVDPSSRRCWLVSEIVPELLPKLWLLHSQLLSALSLNTLTTVCYSICQRLTILLSVQQSTESKHGSVEFKSVPRFNDIETDTAMAFMADATAAVLRVMARMHFSCNSSVSENAQRHCRSLRTLKIPGVRMMNRFVDRAFVDSMAVDSGITLVGCEPLSSSSSPSSSSSSLIPESNGHIRRVYHAVCGSRRLKSTCSHFLSSILLMNIEQCQFNRQKMTLLITLLLRNDDPLVVYAALKNLCSILSHKNISEKMMTRVEWKSVMIECVRILSLRSEWLDRRMGAAINLIRVILESMPLMSIEVLSVSDMWRIVMDLAKQSRHLSVQHSAVELLGSLVSVLVSEQTIRDGDYSLHSLQEWLELLTELSVEVAPEETRAVVVCSLRQSKVFFTLHNTRDLGCELRGCVVKLWMLALRLLLDFESAVRSHIAHVISPLLRTTGESASAIPSDLSEVGFSPKYALPASLAYLTRQWWSLDLVSELTRVMMAPDLGHTQWIFDSMESPGSSRFRLFLPERPNDSFEPVQLIDELADSLIQGWVDHVGHAENPGIQKELSNLSKELCRPLIHFTDRVIRKLGERATCLDTESQVIWNVWFAHWSSVRRLRDILVVATQSSESQVRCADKSNLAFLESLIEESKQLTLEQFPLAKASFLNCKH